MLQDVFAEIRAVRSWQRNSANADAFAARFNRNQADELSLIATYYPGIRPSAAMAAVTGGYRADHPFVGELARLSEALNLREHPAGIQFGQPAITPGMRNRAVSAQREAQMRQQLRTQEPIGRERERDYFARTPDELVEARTRGILDDEGNLRLPVERRYEDGEYRFDSADDERAWNLFHEMAAVAAREMPDERLLFEGPDGGPRLYHGATGVIENLENRPDSNLPRLRIPGTELSLPNISDVAEWGTNTRMVDLPGQAGEVQRDLQAGGFAPETPSDVVQQAFMAMDAPVQEIQGLARTLYATTHGQGFNPQLQSDLSVAWRNPRLSAGEGWFVDPESQVAQKRREIEAQYGQIGGHNVTIGRWAADLVPSWAGLGLSDFDPDTRPYMVLSGLVDAGVQVVADPTAIVLGGAGKARQTRSLFAAADETAGGVRGLRWMVRPTNVAHTLDQNPQVLSALADEASPYNIWRASNRKLPMDLARRLADDAHDPDAVRRILEPELGRRVREVDTFTGLTPSMRRPTASWETVDSGLTRGSKINIMPTRGRIDAHDADVVAWEVEASLRNAKASDEVIAEAVDRVARAGDNPIRLNAAMRRAVDDSMNDQLVAYGWDETVRSQVLRLHQQASEEASRTFSEVVSFQGPTNINPMMRGEVRQMADVNLINELAPKWMTMPDGREIRRMVTDFPHIFGKNVFARADGSARLPTALLDSVVGRAWKPMQLMRAAWTLRVIGEEQVRMAAAGYDSMFRHPLSFIAWRTGTRGNVDVLGSMIDTANQFKAAMARGHGGWLDSAMVPTGVRREFYRDSVHEAERFNQAWGSELIRLSNDPVAAHVANSDNLDNAVEWFNRGAGRGFKGDLAVAYPTKVWDDDAGRAYIEMIDRRIRHATGGNADLHGAIRTGRLNGKTILNGTEMDTGLPGILDSYRANAPETMIGEELAKVGRAEHFGQRWDRAVDSLFGVLMTNRTNNLSRSPVFKQEYWREGQRLKGALTPEEGDRLIAAAQDAGLSRRAIKKLRSTRSVGEASLEELDLWAKGHALDRTKDLLYDLTRRSRFFDAARIVAPFGEAWWEVTTRWLGRDGIIANNPAVVRRFQQMVMGARGEDFGEVMGAPEGEGFFWRNEFGEEVFVIPGFEFLTEHTLGVPVPMTGSVEGLSMFGDVIPGLGPAVQIPVGWILQQKPGPQWVKEMLGDIEALELPVTGKTVRDTLLPFGSLGSTDQGELTDPLNQVHPWMRTAWDFVTNGDGNERQFGTAVKSVMAYLYSTGEYGNTREELNRLQSDATSKARWLTLIRAIGQATSPTAPAPDWMVVDRNDRTIRLRALAEEYQKLKDEDYATADKEFLDQYGEHLLGAVQSQSSGVEYAIPTTREGAQWVLENPGVEGSLPHTYGFFAPQGGDDEDFDYTLWADQFRTGDRVQLDPKTFGRLMANTAAGMHYADALVEVGDDRYTDAGQAYLSEIKEWIWERYPTWQDSSRTGNRPETDVMIRELADNLDNKAIMNTDAGRGLRLYWDYRQQVVDAHGTKSDGTLSEAADMIGAHRYLTDVAEWVVSEHPDFEMLFDIVLSRELRRAEDVELEEAA